MGYIANSMEIDMRIPKEYIKQFIEKIKVIGEYKGDWTDKSVIEDYLGNSGYDFVIEEDGSVKLSHFCGKWREKEIEVFDEVTKGFVSFIGEDNEMWGYKYELGQAPETFGYKMVIDDGIDYKALAEKQKEYIDSLKADYDLTYKMYDVNNTFANGMTDDDIVREETDFDTYEDLDMASAKAQAKRIKLEKELGEFNNENK